MANGFHSGGPVDRGRPFIAGETGPEEFFVPLTALPVHRRHSDWLSIWVPALGLVAVLQLVGFGLYLLFGRG